MTNNYSLRFFFPIATVLWISKVQGATWAFLPVSLFPILLDYFQHVESVVLSALCPFGLYFVHIYISSMYICFLIFTLTFYFCFFLSSIHLAS